MDEPILVTATPAGGERRRLVILVGIGVALVLAALVVPKVLGGGGGGSDPLEGSLPLVTTTTAPAPNPAQAETVAHSGKDPFQPLVTPRAPEKAAPPVVATPRKTVVKLQDVYVDKAYRPAARLKVDANDVVVRVGQQFNGSYRVLTLDVNTKCGQFLFGDQPFDLCIGEDSSF